MTPANPPLLSVVMPVHNAAPFLNESVGSILAQSFGEFEFIICDDASSDGSSELLRTWADRDRRIRLHRSAVQLGLSGSSNAVVAKARASIVARMDADDIAHPERLARQLAVMQQHPDAAVVGTLCNGIDARGRVVRPRDRWRLVRRSAFIPFPHGSAMFRRAAFDLIGGYDEKAAGGEDQDLFSRMAAHGRVLTLPDVLYSYRYHSHNATLGNGARAVYEQRADSGNGLAAFYMLGAMRLWAGESPKLLGPMLQQQSLKWNASTLAIFGAALWGHISPPTLRMMLRGSIRARDCLAGIRVRDGRPCEWRCE